MAFVLLIVAIACIGYGCIVIASGATGGTLLMGIAALVLGAALILAAARPGSGGGKHR